MWSDETWAIPRKHEKAKVTRRIGPLELYHPDCVEFKYRKKIGWMFWGSISGIYGKGAYLFWKKEWGITTPITYRKHPLAVIHSI